MRGFKWSIGAVVILILMAVLLIFFIRPTPYGQIDPIYFGIIPAPWFYVMAAHVIFAILLGILAFKFDLYSWVDQEVIKKEGDKE